MRTIVSAPPCDPGEPLHAEAYALASFAPHPILPPSKSPIPVPILQGHRSANAPQALSDSCRLRSPSLRQLFAIGLCRFDRSRWWW